MKKRHFVFLFVVLFINSISYSIEIEKKFLGYKLTLEKESAETLKNFLNYSVDKAGILSFLEILTKQKRPEIKILAAVISIDLILFKKKLNDNMGVDGVYIRVWGVEAKNFLVSCTYPVWLDFLQKNWKNTISAATTVPLYWEIRPRGKHYREVANKALKNVNSDVAIKALVEALKDDNSCVRVGAAGALGKIKSEESIEPLIQALKDEDFQVRREAALALGKIKSKKAIVPLTKALKDEYSSVRAAAAKALGKIYAK